MISRRSIGDRKVKKMKTYHLKQFPNNPEKETQQALEGH